jgi:RNA-directed DNA polymerase
VQGYYQYHPLPGNTGQLRVFRRRICRLWRSVLVRRSEREQVGRERLNPRLNPWIPRPYVLHPYPDKRFEPFHSQ